MVSMWCIGDLMVHLCFRDVDEVHEMMDDIAEQQEVANEIGEAISNPVGFGQDLDEVCIIVIIDWQSWCAIQSNLVWMSNMA